jgi:hypothetical protein
MALRFAFHSTLSSLVSRTLCCRRPLPIERKFWTPWNPLDVVDGWGHRPPSEGTVLGSQADAFPGMPPIRIRKWNYSLLNAGTNITGQGVPCNGTSEEVR